METMRAKGLPKMPYCSYSDPGAAVAPMLAMMVLIQHLSSVVVTMA